MVSISRLRALAATEIFILRHHKIVDLVKNVVVGQS